MTDAVSIGPSTGSAAAEAAPLMRLDAVTQEFATRRGRITAVDAVSLDLRAGSVVCLVGESGSGKTTTARVAAGLNSPTGGTVTFNGRDVSGLHRRERAAYRRRVQYIHQDPYASLNPTRTVESTLLAPIHKHKMAPSRRAANELARELLTRVDLTPPENYLPKYPHQLSGGQRQRVSIARALTMDPLLIIADEATSMLDVSIRISMLNVLGKLRDDLDVGFLFITHDLALARYFGWDGEIAVMYLGRVVEQGPTPEVIRNPAHPYTRALLEAIPEPDPALTRNKTGGQLRTADVPSLLDIPQGCPFHPRCPMSRPGTCDIDLPMLHEVSPWHRAACERLDAVEAEMPLSTEKTRAEGKRRP